ncbi:MAG: gliding motility-associated ABC transporter ATP-binding subunit GldA [Bacteroidota bacterium]|nr:gliding motility-associated ABC transporter ATP-binding subunit GldA [Bacteroidota bacterium]
MSIVISNLTKNYGTQKAVDNISFQVNNNEIVGFLGPNGAGKSTTMKIVTGYIAPDSGSASVSGIDALAKSLEAKKQIGYLPESNPLYFEMYVREYLEFIGRIHKITDLKERIEDVINLTGLKPESKKKIGQLSKGYKQRVGLAAALIHDPKVLILDEPTSGLDPNQIIEIREVIKELGKNKTVLFSSHILQEVESICDRVIIINKGNIVADDTLSNLRKANKSSHIIIVEFAQPVDSTLLGNIEGVIGAEEEKPSTFKLETLDPDLLKRNLFSFSLTNNLNILSLKSESKSLEDVFRNLTN